MKTKQETMTIKGKATSIGVTSLAMLINAQFEDGHEIKLEVTKDEFIKTLVGVINYQSTKEDEARSLDWRDIQEYELNTCFVINNKDWSSPRLYSLQNCYKNGNNHFKQFKNGRVLAIKRNLENLYNVKLFKGEI
jgi:hypothetical protein